MKNQFIRRLFPPKEIATDYWLQTVHSNARITSIVVSFCVAVQFFNLYNLFVLSESKLGTLNNRIYFGFYCSMLFLCILYSISSYMYADNLNRLVKIQCAGFSFWLIWCTALNYYDLIQAGHSVSIVVFVTGLFGTAICIQMVPWYAWINYLFVGGFFIARAFPVLGLGESWNLFIGLIMVLIISYARFSYTIKNIQNRNRIEAIHKELLDKTEALDANLQKYNYILKQTNNIILDWDLERDTAIFTDNWKSLFGLPTEISDFSLWVPPSRFLSAQNWADLTAKLKSASKTGRELEAEALLTDIHGENRWYSFRFKFQTDSHGIRKYGLGYLEDISKHKQEIFRLKSTAKSDPLTGLLNRQGLYEYFQEQLIQKSRDTELAMILLDIDGFKEINDRYGHPCGDQALVHLSQILRKNFRNWDGICRIGGDEFMVVLSLSGDPSILNTKVESLLNRTPKFTWEGHTISLSYSIGVAIWNNDTFETLYKKADLALYAVKHHEKGSYRIYSPGL